MGPPAAEVGAVVGDGEAEALAEVARPAEQVGTSRKVARRARTVSSPCSTTAARNSTAEAVPAGAQTTLAQWCMP